MLLNVLFGGINLSSSIVQVTLVGKQSGREIRSYKTESGDELLLLHYGFRRAIDIFQHEHAQNRMSTWLYRAIGWFVSFLGYNCQSTVLEMMGR